MVGAMPMVGRAAELELGSAAYGHVAEGYSHLFLISGEAGIGKTRLVEELCARAEAAPGGAQVRIGESAPLAGTGLAYGPFVAALGGQAGWLLHGDGGGDMLTERHRLFVRVHAILGRSFRPEAVAARLGGSALGR